MADTYCPDCKRPTEVVFDHSAGDTVCSECGLVLEAHSIDETSEWRTFANESTDNDPVRVGGPSNPLLADGGLSTVISKPTGASGDFLTTSLGRWQNRGSNPDRSLIQAFKTIATMSDRLGLVATIKDRANEIYKKVEDQKPLRGRNQDAILAACLYIACRQEDKPRTVKEICSVANGATKKEIGRAKEYIVKQLEVELGQSMEMGTIHAGDFLRRFCSHLGMNNQAVKAAQEAVQKSEELDIRRSPISIAAAIIYIITQLSEDKKLLKDISLSTGVAEGTIRNSYKDLYPYAARIIPSCNLQFEQKTDRFWEFQEQSNTWVEVELPYDLVSCVNDNCTKVGSIDQITENKEDHFERDNDVSRHTGSFKHKDSDRGGAEQNSEIVLPQRKRISLTRMSDTSIWITGESGSIYERFWNGVQWVIAPHDLPVSAGYAICVFIVNQTILALSEAGILYQNRWLDHGRPPGGNVAAIADAGTIRPEVAYTISSTGDLYEYDKSSKPSWKKHIWTAGMAEDVLRIPSTGYTINGLSGDYSSSLFLLTRTGTALENQIPEAWLSHMHPPHAKAAKGITGLQLQIGRIIFTLDDGRLAELHLPGLDAPETEGWNAEYCKQERGPTNCITGIKDEPNDSGITRAATRRRKGSQAQQDYLLAGASELINSSEGYNFPDNWINTNFRLRVMHGSRSFFLITDGGLTFEYLNTENIWLWLRHDHSTPMKGALGNYNGSLFFVDIYGSLLIRERSGNDLGWLNCTAMRKGKQVTGGPPWDGIPGKAMKVTAEDALFFVSKNGRLLQFTVALRKFIWKDCRNPPNTKVASIVDQELFRGNIVFVVGRNGRLYQYNKVTELWHKHYQSPHLILSRFPGTAMRSSSLSLTGSLFMLSEDGGLVEYHWNTGEGWKWVEHGTPNKDGKVYMRYMDQMTWSWKNCGFPCIRQIKNEDRTQVGAEDKNEEFCIDKDISASLEKDAENFSDLNGNCDLKVASTRPIPFSEDSVIFELRGQSKQQFLLLVDSFPNNKLIK
ncbi:hypothetical protein GH714_027995 [Hevea brasiliensis]|uniref:TFIIB-type domain-containing protein n=1 Tax=Hevea brasiliensis TaxID=3981 RepID=A0A6A6ME81_HEVBR|nr:hypothetical protein GH714_027995 [Hevea brasiliensis]